MMRPFLILCFALGLTGISAQSALSIGEWEVHLPFKAGQHVTQSNESIYYASQFALMKIDKSTFERTYITKKEGLSDVKINALAYDENTDQLLLVYENTKIDVIAGDQVYLVNDIFEKSILGDKSIYDIFISDEGLAYLSTGFGVVQFDMESRLFGFFAETDFKANAFIEHEGFWYAATEDGLYSFDKNSTANPANFAAWTLLTDMHGLEALYEAKDLYISQEGALYLATDSGIYRKVDETNFESVLDLPGSPEPQFIFEYEGNLHCAAKVGEESELFEITPSGLIQLDISCTDRTNGAVLDQNGILWIADEYENIRYLQNGECKRLYSIGPRSSEMSELLFFDDTLYVASGGVADNFTYTYERAGLYQFADRKWTNYHEFNTPIIADSSLINIYALAKNTRTDNLMVGTYWNGILDFDLNTRTGPVYNQYTGTSLQGAVGDDKRTRVAGMKYDREGNLWISNFGSSRPLSVFTVDGVWHSFPTGNTTFLTDIVIDNFGYKWIVVGGTNGGVLVYDDAGTIANPLDDNTYFFNSSRSELETNIIHSIAIDNDGDVWVGSDMGPVIFQCGPSLFEGECQGSTKKVLQDSIPAILLQTESIRALHIDGANRKWFGTTNGIYVQTANAETQVHHYTTANSPLLDNTIIDFAYDEDNGIMYIATNSGLNALRTEATGANFSHSGTATVFPNPVRPEYEGPIAISGLGENVNFKITDVNGLLVYEGTSLGGQAIWDGFDYTGRKASTGVYLVFSSTTDTFRDPDTFVTKFLIVK